MLTNPSRQSQVYACELLATAQYVVNKSQLWEPSSHAWFVGTCVGDHVGAFEGVEVGEGEGASEGDAVGT